MSIHLHILHWSSIVLVNDAVCCLFPSVHCILWCCLHKLASSPSILEVWWVELFLCLLVFCEVHCQMVLHALWFEQHDNPCRYCWWESVVGMRKLAVAALVIYLHTIDNEGIQLLVGVHSMINVCFVIQQPVSQDLGPLGSATLVCYSKSNVLTHLLSNEYDFSEARSDSLACSIANLNLNSLECAESFLQALLVQQMNVHWPLATLLLQPTNTWIYMSGM